MYGLLSQAAAADRRRCCWEPTAAACTRTIWSTRHGRDSDSLQDVRQRSARWTMFLWEPRAPCTACCPKRRVQIDADAAGSRQRRRALGQCL